MRSTCLEVIESLRETGSAPQLYANHLVNPLGSLIDQIDVRNTRKPLCRGNDLQLISGLASGNERSGNSETFLHSSGLYEMSCIHVKSASPLPHPTSQTYPLDQQHPHEILLLARLIHRDPTEPTQQNMVQRRVIQDMVRG